MIKRLLTILVMLFAAQLSNAAVEVNTADKAGLSTIKDIGPKTADAILAERTKGGKFKDWDDLVKRVKGVGPKNSIAMSSAGLTVEGAAKPDAPAKPADGKAKDAKAKDKPMSAKDTKDAKADKPMAAASADKAKDAKPEPKKDETKK